jgi:hypothetical protein
MTAGDREAIASKRRAGQIQDTIVANAITLEKAWKLLSQAVAAMAQEWLRIRLAVPRVKEGTLNYDDPESIRANPFRNKPQSGMPQSVIDEQVLAINLFLKTMKPVLPFLRAELRPEHYRLPGNSFPFHGNTGTWFEVYPMLGNTQPYTSSILFTPTALWRTMFDDLKANSAATAYTDGFIKASLVGGRQLNLNAHQTNELAFRCRPVFKGMSETNSFGIVTLVGENALRCSFTNEGYTLTRGCHSGFSVNEKGAVPYVSHPTNLEHSCNLENERLLKIIVRVLQRWADVQVQAPLQLALVTETVAKNLLQEQLAFAKAPAAAAAAGAAAGAAQRLLAERAAAAAASAGSAAGEAQRRANERNAAAAAMSSGAAFAAEAQRRAMAPKPTADPKPAAAGGSTALLALGVLAGGGALYYVFTRKKKRT